MALRVPVAATLVLVAFFCASCGSITDPSKNTVDTLPGTLNPGATVCSQTINVSNGGEFTIKLTALQPSPTAVLIIGWYQGAGCQLLAAGPNYAQLNQVALSGPVYQAGAYSVSLGDPGTLTVAQTFTVTVSHP